MENILDTLACASVPLIIFFGPMWAMMFCAAKCGRKLWFRRLWRKLNALF